jgi:hypothetical protein
MLYVFYLISHKLFPELIYVGSTNNLYKRKNNHKSSCFNQNSNNYNTLLYQFIRNNNINFDELQFEILDEFECDARGTATQFEQLFIDQFSMKLNMKDAYTTKKDKEYMDDYRKKNKEHKRETDKRYYENNKETILEQTKEYRKNNKEQLSEYFKEYNQKNKEKISEKNKEYNEKNKEKITVRRKEYREKNWEKINQRILCPNCNLEISKKSLARHIRRNHPINSASEL